MITVIFDTNIFISAFEFGGVPRDAFLLASAGLFDVHTSKPLLDELSRVLRDRFEYSGEEVTEIRQRLERLCTVIEPTDRITVCSDPDDNRVLECAVAAQAGSLLPSGDIETAWRATSLLRYS